MRIQSRLAMLISTTTHEWKGLSPSITFGFPISYFLSWDLENLKIILTKCCWNVHSIGFVQNARPRFYASRFLILDDKLTSVRTNSLSESPITNCGNPSFTQLMCLSFAFLAIYSLSWLPNLLLLIFEPPFRVILSEWLIRGSKWK